MPELTLEKEAAVKAHRLCLPSGNPNSFSFKIWKKGKSIGGGMGVDVCLTSAIYEPWVADYILNVLKNDQLSEKEKAKLISTKSVFDFLIHEAIPDYCRKVQEMKILPSSGGPRYNARLTPGIVKGGKVSTRGGHSNI